MPKFLATATLSLKGSICAAWGFHLVGKNINKSLVRGSGFLEMEVTGFFAQYMDFIIVDNDNFII